METKKELEKIREKLSHISKGLHKELHEYNDSERIHFERVNNIARFIYLAENSIAMAIAVTQEDE